MAINDTASGPGCAAICQKRRPISRVVSNNFFKVGCDYLNLSRLDSGRGQHGFQMRGQLGHEPPVLRLEYGGRQNSCPNRREECGEAAV
jgi:hypothetical protein